MPAVCSTLCWWVLEPQKEPEKGLRLGKLMTQMHTFSRTDISAIRMCVQTPTGSLSHTLTVFTLRWSIKSWHIRGLLASWVEEHGVTVIISNGS